MFASGMIAAFTAVAVWISVETFGRIYPTRETWRKLRRTRGRLAIRLMRERFEAAGEKVPARRIAMVLFALLLAWAGAAPGLFQKRWYDTLLDVTPSLIVILALIRIPAVLRAVAQRIRSYEESVGEDPDKPLFGDEEGGDDGPTAAVL
jgi:hypothetical protein